jgi:hypothetical protein
MPFPAANYMGPAGCRREPAQHSYSTGEILRRIEVPGAASGYRRSPDGRFAATHPSSDGISVIDLEKLR